MTSLRRPNRVEIDLGAIGHNFRQICKNIEPGTRIVAALKANAYGFGLDRVADTLVSQGVDAVAVADLHDAVTLREQGHQLPLLLYAGNLVDEEAVRAIERYALMPSIIDTSNAQRYASIVQRTVRVIVKVDVGLERLGVVPSEAVDVVRIVTASAHLQLAGIYTHVHLPQALESEAYIDWQVKRFFDVCSDIESDGVTIPSKMIASSALLRHSRELGLDAVDPGHLLFGLTPPGPCNVDYALRPALVALKSTLIHTRRVDRSAFRELAPITLRDGMRIGVLPIGLRDGMRSLNCGAVLVRGQRAAIIGGISLEHTRLDLTDVPSACVGDEVVIIGQQGDATISADEVIEYQGFAVKAELALAVRSSIKRDYL